MSAKSSDQLESWIQRIQDNTILKGLRYHSTISKKETTFNPFRFTLLEAGWKGTEAFDANSIDRELDEIIMWERIKNDQSDFFIISRAFSILSRALLLAGSISKTFSHSCNALSKLPCMARATPRLLRALKSAGSSSATFLK